MTELIHRTNIAILFDCSASMKDKSGLAIGKLNDVLDSISNNSTVLRGTTVAVYSYASTFKKQYEVHGKDLYSVGHRFSCSVVIDDPKGYAVEPEEWKKGQLVEKHALLKAIEVYEAYRYGHGGVVKDVPIYHDEPKKIQLAFGGFSKLFNTLDVVLKSMPTPDEKTTNIVYAISDGGDVESTLTIREMKDKVDGVPNRDRWVFSYLDIASYPDLERVGFNVCSRAYNHEQTSVCNNAFLSITR